MAKLTKTRFELSPEGIVALCPDLHPAFQTILVLGFFDGLIGNFDLGRLGIYSNHPHVLGILDGVDSAGTIRKGE